MRSILLPAFLLAFTLAGAEVRATATGGGDVSAADLAIALRKVNTLGTVLYVAAHPDDENTSLLAWLARERCVRAAYLSVTRGDGGQNLIGNEKGPLIGLLRTQELLAARRIDGAEQFFTRAIDFGYSKGPEETLQMWGKDDVLADMVWVIRNIRPDVIITRFPTNGDGGHGHHTASAILAGEAFKAAADPSRFPEQLKYTKTWQAKRLLWNSWNGRPGDSAPIDGAMQVDIGSYNSILGKSYTEIAGASRSQHKSQGFGAPERRGSRIDNLQIVAGEPAKSDFLENVDMTWARVPGSASVAKLLAEAEAAFDVHAPEKIVPLLLKAHEELTKLGGDPWVEIKKKEVLELIRGASGLWLEAVAGSAAEPPGESVKIAATALVRGNVKLQMGPPEITYSSGIESKITNLRRNDPNRTEVQVKIPADAPFTEPYWLRETPSKGLYAVNDARQIGEPESPAAMNVKFTIIADGQNLEYTVPVVYRWVDPVKGEITRPFIIAPRVTAAISEKVYLFSGTTQKNVLFRVKAGAALAGGIVKPSLPAGWKCSPEEITFLLEKKGDELDLNFIIQPENGAASGELGLFIQYKDGTGAPARSIIQIDYAHIPLQTLFPRASAALLRTDLQIRGKNIGYIEGAGDDVADSLRQMGWHVHLLTDAELETGELAGLDAIVAGVRAYNTRPRLRFAQKRLMEYVNNGGTMVVQYNTMQELAVPSMGPFPLVIGRDRVTVEEAPVTFINKNHPLLSAPNPITDNDFNNWVQERGLYFARMDGEREGGAVSRFGPGPQGSTDSHYVPVLEMNDPGETVKKGSLLFAQHGKGIFIYTGLAFFRQLPAGVPGAWRLFANLVSARGEK